MKNEWETNKMNKVFVQMRKVKYRPCDFGEVTSRPIQNSRYMQEGARAANGEIQI